MVALQEKLRRVLLLIFFGIIIFVLYSGFSLQIVSNDEELHLLKVRSIDKGIKVSWDEKKYTKINEVLISVSSEGNEIIHKIVDPAIGEFLFSDESYNSLYTISITPQYIDGGVGETQVFNRILLDFDQCPDILCFDIDTMDGKEPVWSIAEKPDDKKVMGETLENNLYSSAIFYISSRIDDMNDEIIGEIKVRGNTSSALSDKKSYRIKFNKKIDLLDKGDKYAHKEWILLQNGSNLNTYLGFTVSEVCGLEFTPMMRFVNVYLNGDWKGIYILVEPIEEIIPQDKITQKGYLFEDSAYWWKSDTIYFRTDHHYDMLGYIIHYPDVKSEDDPRIAKLKNYMQRIENYMINSDKKALDYVDLDSFARWMISKDLLEMEDAGGTNMYYYINIIDDDDLSKEKLKMGPGWDFDACFIKPGWSKQHVWEKTFYYMLWKYKEFKQLYIIEWGNIRKKAFDSIEEALYRIKKQEDEINVSRYMDSIRWGKQYVKLQDEIDVDLHLFTDQIKWIESHLEEL